jgi:toluene monooxygenase system ferredoxin subunit
VTLVRAIALADLWDGDMTGVVVGGHKVLLVRKGDEVRAFADRCAHLGVPISEGSLDGDVLTCRAHHYTYSACTGEGINPASVRLTRYPVAIRDGAVFVDVGGQA